MEEEMDVEKEVEVEVEEEDSMVILSLKEDEAQKEKNQKQAQHWFQEWTVQQSGCVVLAARVGVTFPITVQVMLQVQEEPALFRLASTSVKQTEPFQRLGYYSIRVPQQVSCVAKSMLTTSPSVYLTIV